MVLEDPKAPKEAQTRDIDLSIIVCTRNRVEALSSCLSAILAAIHFATLSIVELIVVDNGSTDGTKFLVDELILTSSNCLIYQYVDAPGLSRARNLGVSVSSGRIVAFTDDDCIVALDFIHELTRVFASDPALTVRGGRVLLGDPRDLPVTIREEVHPEVYGAQRLPGGFALGANLSMHQEVLNIVGAFDVRFGAGATLRAAEDTDFLVRAYLAGIRLVYTPSICVSHFHGRRVLKEASKLEFGYAIGDGAMYLKHIRRNVIRLWVWHTIKDAINEAVGRQNFGQRNPRYAQSRLAGNIAGAILFCRETIRKAMFKTRYVNP